MSTTSIEQISNLAAAAELLIIRGYPIYTIYADQNEIHVDVPDGMPEPTAMETSSCPSGPYEHRKGTYGGVSITWLVSKQEAA